MKFSLIRNRRGNAVVEFAYILPLLLLLVVGITEFGRAWLTFNLMHTATREGARLAAVSSLSQTSLDNVSARVIDICSNGAVSPVTVTVTDNTGSNGAANGTVEVLVEYNFNFILGGKPFTVTDAAQGQSSNTILPSIPMRAKTVMIHEASATS